MKVYMSTISAWHNRKGFRSPTSQNPILKLVIKGAKRIHANNKSNEARRQPITLDVLQTLIRLLQSSHCCLNQHDQRMLQAAFTVAFYGLLRISELAITYMHAKYPGICGMGCIFFLGYLVRAYQNS